VVQELAEWQSLGTAAWSAFDDTTDRGSARPRADDQA